MFLQLIGHMPALPLARHDYTLRRLGTVYGGWVFAETPIRDCLVVVSCGLGEDASFDVEYAARYGAKVIAVDPTPRAIRHFQLITARLGSPKTQAYTSSGLQPVEAYDLSRITAGQLLLCDKAIWNVAGELRFFAPANPQNVSYSAVNFQNDYSTETPHIVVEATTMDQLMSAFGLNDISLLKLDIEGAEVEVILDMLAKGIRPRQVLVEYDELAKPGPHASRRVAAAHAALIAAGYSLINAEFYNFTYIRH